MGIIFRWILILKGIGREVLVGVERFELPTSCSQSKKSYIDRFRKNLNINCNINNIDDIAQILFLRTPAQNSYKTQPITA